ncbi:hypothetical protein phiAS5_ORF0135 [Aeromonas phage phiAS5]|uniref:Uncharacterized protein n=1 Tax=Aeromonas phage phiAS5 TaxID=879630 RepID=E1A2N2_9CAUD|nr:hypothetical protein phiAS5_ORF0135 [Aeromonas phage phiAS5]ADM79978.1 hypothetical protein phiAS5_ORF0135 [Aeromonas phage phiAS5]
MQINEVRYNEILATVEGAFERTSYGFGEMTTAIYNKDGKQLAVRIVTDAGTDYEEGEE